MRWSCVATLAISLVTPAARADDDPRKQRAEALFREGLSLHDADLESDALAKFEEAYALFPSPNALYWIGREKHLLGRKLEALGLYREALRMPLLSPKAADLARQYIAELEPAFARLKVTGPDGVRFRLGERELRLPLADPLDVEPGHVELHGERDGARFVGIADVRAGTLTALALEAVPSAMPVVKAEEKPSTARIVVSASLAAVGIGGLVLGGVFLSEGNSATDEARTLLDGQGCRGSNSPECVRASELQSDRDRNATLSAVSFVVGAAVVAGAVATWFFWPQQRASVSAAGTRMDFVIRF